MLKSHGDRPLGLRRGGAGLPAATLAAVWVLAASGCMSVPPHAAPEGVQTGALVPAGKAGANWPAAQWWKQYGNPELDSLVEAALRDAPSVAAAQSRLDAAAAVVKTAFAERQIQVTADAQAQRQRLSDNGLLPPKLLGFSWYSPAELGITARYGLNPGGRKRAEQTSATARTAAALAERAAAELALSHAVVENYIGWQLDKSSLNLAQQRVTLIESELRSASERAAAGLARGDDALLAEQQRLAAVERSAGYAVSMELHHVAIAALVRTAPAALPAFTARDLPLPAAALPATATLDLMARRADLIAARARIDAAAADTDAARAGYLPDMDLRALFGLSSRDLERLLQSGSWAPQFTAAVHLPLFDAGRVRSLHASALAELRGAVADYNDRLLHAAEEVNRALVERDAAAILQHTRSQQVDAGAKLVALAQQRATAGLSDSRPQLAATQRWLEGQEALLEAQQLQWTGELKLIRALGGGYGASDERQR